MSEPLHNLDHDERDWPAPGEWTYQDCAVTVYGLDEDRTRYVELARGEEGERVSSAVLPELTVTVEDLFP